MKIGLPKRKLVFQPSLFRGKLGVSFREGNWDDPPSKMGVGKTPKMDGENNGEPYFLMDNLGGFTPLFFGNTQMAILEITPLPLVFCTLRGWRLLFFSWRCPNTNQRCCAWGSGVAVGRCRWTKKHVTRRILGMSWGVKLTCFEAPGVSLGGSGVSTGGVRILI